MENISIYLSDSENLYYLIFLSLLISIFIIAYRKRDINLYLLCKKYLQRYFNLIRNYSESEKDNYNKLSKDVDYTKKKYKKEKKSKKSKKK